MKNIQVNTQNQTLVEIPISKIHPNPGQPRKTFKLESLRELADSLKEHGLLEPIVVEPGDQDGFVIVAGERRWRAAKLAGLRSLSAVVRERTNHNGRERLISGIVENVQREDMNPIEEGEAYQRLIADGMSVIEISKRVGKHTTHIYNALSRLELAPKVIEIMRSGQISTDMRIVTAIKDLPQDVQVGLIERAAQYKMTIPGIVAAARKVRKSLRSAPIQSERKAKSPAMRVGRQTYEAMREVDDDTPPSKWNAMKQLGKVPSWEAVVSAANSMCGRCALKSMASLETCRDCPGVDLLGLLSQEAR